MKRSSHSTKKPATRYLSQKRSKHERKPTCDFILPSPKNHQHSYRMADLLNETKINQKIPPFNELPATVRLKEAELKRIFGSLSRNSIDGDPQKKTPEPIKLNLINDMKKISFSSPSNRYKRPLSDREIKIGKLDIFQKLNNSGKEQKLNVSKQISSKKFLSAFSLTKRDISPIHQRLLSKTPSNSTSSNKQPKILFHSYCEDNAKKRAVEKPGRRSVIKTRPQAQLSQKGNGFEYTLHYGFRTKKGFTPNNPNKPNQDSYVLCPSIQNKTWQHYFGVNDGHGVFGHEVSSFLKSQISTRLGSANLDTPQQALLNCYKSIYHKLIQSEINATFSGSTMTGCFMQNEKLYCCNVGDSRVVLGRRGEKGLWEAKQLSRDHKPTIAEEAERILKAGGRVEAYKDAEGREMGPLRVWIQNQQVPGLAMTRSFGDLVAASVGVACQPQITEYTLTTQDQIIVVASDGVWEFLENESIISKLGYFYQDDRLEQACDWLLHYANATWKQSCSAIDDITFIVIFLSYD